MVAAPVWTTACDGEPPETLPAELAVLREHVAQCSAARGHFITLRCGLAWLLQAVTARLVTTTAVIAVLAAAAMMWR